MYKLALQHGEVSIFGTLQIHSINCNYTPVLSVMVRDRKFMPSRETGLTLFCLFIQPLASHTCRASKHEHTVCCLLISPYRISGFSGS